MKVNSHQKTALVTGAAGFVGSHLCDSLLERGYVVYGVDNYITGTAKNLQHLKDNSNFHFIEADISQPVSNYLSTDIRFDLVFHFASPASPPRYQAHPVATYLANSLGTHYLLQYIKQVSPQSKFVFASTSEVYGDPLEHPQTESYWGNVNPNGVRACYDESKRLGETICGVHARDFALDVRIVRIFNTYGSRMDLSDGRIIPNFINQALADKALTIYGDGTQTRSFCFVADLIAGVVRMGVSEGLAGKTINLGNPDSEQTILATAEVIRQVFDKPNLPIEFRPLPSDDPTRRKPDITAAKRLLDWQPKVGFLEGLSMTVKNYI